MGEQPELAKIAKTLKGLTLALWCLVVVSVVQMGAWLLPFVAPDLYVKTATSGSAPKKTAFEPWDGLSLEEKVKRSSMILITQYRRDGEKLRAIIKEIPKRQPNTEFYYSLGEEYPPSSVTPRENTSYGEGDIVLLQGSPATRRESYAIYNSSIPGLGDLPLEKLRKIIAETK